jgi:hypothetical protein
MVQVARALTGADEGSSRTTACWFAMGIRKGAGPFDNGWRTLGVAWSRRRTGRPMPTRTRNGSSDRSRLKVS